MAVIHHIGVVRTSAKFSMFGALTPLAG